MRPLLVLRPEPGASRTVEQARRRGLDAVAVPLFEVEPVTWQAPDATGYDALLLTSVNAVRHGGAELEKLRGLPVHAVGAATAHSARERGFDISSTGDAGVDRLLASIEPGLRLLHLCGTDRRSPKKPRQQVTPLPVYRSTPLQAPDLGAASGSVALIHSPRAGARFAEVAPDRGTIAIAAISDAAADAVGAGWQTIATADSPTDDALLALAASLCETSWPK